MNTIIVKTNDATQTIDQVQVVTKDGVPTVIKASAKVNYEFHDNAITVLLTISLPSVSKMTFMFHLKKKVKKVI